MSTALVHRQLFKFLRSPEPEVLCIRGKWGVGKTYAWDNALKAAQADHAIALPRYAYVSLFGVNSLDELKLAIFENTIILKKGTLKANVETLDEFISSIGSWRKIAKFAQSVPLLKSIVTKDNSALLSFLTIRGQIVCIDDLERKGKNLDIGDILGLASLLREQRDCKIVLLFNEERLEKEAQEKLNSYLEKVVDVSLVHAPTVEEALSVAITEDADASRLTKELCSKLDISNIRIIKKIERYIRDAKLLTESYDRIVFEKVSASIALFGWAHLQPNEAPSIEFLTTKKLQNNFGLKDESLTDDEARWNTILDLYGFSWTDELDLELLKGIRAGYFNTDIIDPYLKKLHEQVHASQADESFSSAWRKYHDSFSSTQDEVLDELYKSFMKNYEYISPLNLNGTVILFKELGRAEQAKEMINFYVENRKDGRQLFDFSEHSFSNDVSDEDVQKAFSAKIVQIDETDAFDIEGALEVLRSTWTDSDIKKLANVPVETYVKILKSNTGVKLRAILRGGLAFNSVSNPTDDMKEFTKRFKDALKIIGAESPLNARRVARYGIKL